MVDVSAIAGAISALKGATDVTQAMIGLRDAQAMQTKIIELNSKILEAQSRTFAANDERAALIEHISKLEEEVVRLKAWDAEKQRYQLTEVGPGVVAFQLKEGMQLGEPPHLICANCCAKGTKSYLQRHLSGPVLKRLKCNTCGEAIDINVTPAGGSSRTRK